MSKTVDALQAAFLADPNAIHALIVNRVPCNQMLARLFAAERSVMVYSWLTTIRRRLEVFAETMQKPRLEKDVEAIGQIVAAVDNAIKLATKETKPMVLPPPEKGQRCVGN